MKLLCYVVAVALCVPALGCKVSKQDVELLERDLRIQEDEIYALQDCVDGYQKKLESCRSENRALRTALAAKGGASDDFLPPSVPSGPAFDPGQGGQLPSAGEPGFPRELDPGQLPEAPPFSPPTISPPGLPADEGVAPGDLIEPLPDDAGAALPARATGSTALVGHTAPRTQGKSPRSSLLNRLASANNEDPPVADPVHDLEVTEITLNRMLTGGMNHDHRNGDEGILIVIEPRNAKNQIVQAFGAISIVLLDPALEGEAARVARWDFTQQELEHRFRTRQFGRGLQLDLPWPGDAPQHSDLHLFVRFVADDGRKLIVDRELKIDPPGGGAEGGWVPATRSHLAVEQGESAEEVELTQPNVVEQTTIVPRPLPANAPQRSAAPAETASAATTNQPAERPEPRVARALPDRPSEPAAKRRPQWTPYR